MMRLKKIHLKYLIKIFPVDKNWIKKNLLVTRLSIE